ncbi:anti-sigma factor family protein [Nocardioides jejuensis]|uniref:Anti-sigma factor n=1 Tax=Nocardioides jejuensis TaxID=2502782 RepID=A0A4R1C2X5_9ACTN|nr:zf-HC2 domain-containing protein [Nocardioides jejuensis]TCJ24116.1 anti-sigma factor [Nocardioides jejuensis]
MSTDPWEYADAAYALGALEPDERAAFERHLASCEACRSRVTSAGSAVGLLARGESPDTPPLPATLLPGLLHQARRVRRRRLVVTGALSGVAAACVLAVVLVAAPLRDGPAREPMAQVGHPPISAEAAVVPTAWGTRITLTCRYLGEPAGYRYALRVRGTDGTVTTLGTWSLGDRDVTFTGGTALPVAEIAAVEVTDGSGTTLLTLDHPGA